MTPYEMALKIGTSLLEVILESVGIDGLMALLRGHPLTRDKVLATEEAAADLAVDALEDAKFPKKTGAP